MDCRLMVYIPCAVITPGRATLLVDLLHDPWWTRQEPLLENAINHADLWYGTRILKLHDPQRGFKQPSTHSLVDCCSFGLRCRIIRVQTGHDLFCKQYLLDQDDNM